MIEVDGGSHDTKRDEDAERDRYLEGLGLTVIRLLAKDVLQNMEGVIAYLKNHPALTDTPPEGHCRENKVVGRTSVRRGAERKRLRRTEVRPTKPVMLGSTLVLQQGCEAIPERLAGQVVFVARME